MTHGSFRWRLVLVMLPVLGLLGTGRFSSCFPATGQTTPSQANKNDGIGVSVDVPDDGTVQAGSPLMYHDLRDGTILDLNTQLVWEKKDRAGGLHDKDDQFVWSGDGTQETIWDWLDDLNNGCANNEDMPCSADGDCGVGGKCGFAGHRNWRIPNVRELLSIVDYGALIPTVDSAFNNNCAGTCTVLQCSCTAVNGFIPGIDTGVGGYWSSTSLPRPEGTPEFVLPAAWSVFFGSGDSSIDTRGLERHVRAVRGGLVH